MRRGCATAYQTQLGKEDQYGRTAGRQLSRLEHAALSWLALPEKFSRALLVALAAHLAHTHTTACGKAYQHFKDLNLADPLWSPPGQALPALARDLHSAVSCPLQTWSQPFQQPRVKVPAWRIVNCA
ncbi:hypothetical protein WJX84_005904 [Apatococcus fuscideae]|uniref:Transposase n=1 Tax=Apatococcus fuscideae TaxID=2026836 RepID=A0AAW1TK07_9CHLO